VQKYSYLSILLLLFACAPQKPKAPDNLLNQTQLSDILTEMHLADAIANGTKSGNLDSVNREAISLNAYILEKHQLTREQFMESFDFYKQNPVLMDSVYAEVITKLSSKEMEYRGK
jgi:hypothetical protein